MVLQPEETYFSAGVYNLPGYFFGRSGSAVRTRRFRRARLETVGPVRIDGEAVQGGGFESVVEPGGLCGFTGPGDLPRLVES